MFPVREKGRLFFLKKERKTMRRKTEKGGQITEEGFPGGSFQRKKAAGGRNILLREKREFSVSDFGDQRVLPGKKTTGNFQSE